MLGKLLLAFAVVVVLTSAPGIASANLGDGPQVIRLQRFRKALWKVHVTIKGKSGDFLLDTGGGSRS